MPQNNIPIAAKLIVEHQACSAQFIHNHLKFEKEYAEDLIDYLQGLGVVGSAQYKGEREVLIKSVEALNTHLSQLFPDSTHLIAEVLGMPESEDETIENAIPKASKPKPDYKKMYYSMIKNTLDFRSYTIDQESDQLVESFVEYLVIAEVGLTRVCEFCERLMAHSSRRTALENGGEIVKQDVDATIVELV